MKKFVIFSCFTAICLFQSRAQVDTLLITGVISKLTPASVTGLKIAVTYYDTASVFIGTDTVITVSSGFYTTKIGNSFVSKVNVSLPACTSTVDRIQKNKTIPNYNGTQFRHDSVDFTNYCYSADFNYFDSSGYVQFYGSQIGGVSPYNSEWDFGDGSALNINPNPFHQWTAIGPIYNVSLTVVDNSLDTAVRVKPINTMNCVAYFAFAVTGPLKVQFQDSSVTNHFPIYKWDFGDSGSSSLKNPQHTYASVGNYNVCLTVTDSLSFCSHDYCDSIFINNPPLCNSQFSFNKKRNMVQFTDLSTTSTVPSALTYKWNFDDGSPINKEASPFHFYESNDSFSVNLVILDTLSLCTDSFSSAVVIKSIDTALIILAGKVDLDGQPKSSEISLISGPAPSDIITRDTISTFKGYYVFDVNPHEVYYVKASLVRSDPQFLEVPPQYYKDSYLWSNARGIVITKENSMDNDISLHWVPPPSGNAVISGNVGMYLGNSIPNKPLPYINVILFNSSGDFISRTESNLSGVYDLTGLNIGSYQVYAEVEGKASYASYIDITSAGQKVDNVDFTVYPTYVMKVAARKPDNSAFSIFPNPVKNILNIRADGGSDREIEWKIYSVYGNAVASGRNRLINGIAAIDVNNLGPGYYLMEVEYENHKGVFTLCKIE